MTKYIKNDILSSDVLKVIKDKYEEKENIKIFSLYQSNNEVIGIFMCTVDDELSLLTYPNTYIYNTLPDGTKIILYELKTLIRFIYNEGSLQLLKVLIHSSDVDIDDENINSYYTIISFIRDHIPYLVAQGRIIELIQQMNITTDNIRKYSYITQIINLINDFNNFYDFDFNSNFIIQNDSANELIKLSSQLNLFAQNLRTITFDKISEKKMVELNDLCIFLQKTI